MAEDKTVSVSCIICGSDEYREICDIKISPILTPSKLVRCKGCGFYYANPRLKKEAEEDYYKKRYHEAEGEDFWYKRRIDVFKRSLREIGKFLKKGRLIDIGCGMGHFMDLARNSGWEVKGVEISDTAVNYASEKLKLEVIKGSLKDAQFNTGYFDVATMWNVLDQIYDPKTNLIETNRILKKGGYLFMRMPNLYFHLKVLRLHNALKRIFKNIKPFPWVFHLYSFDKDSIKRLLESTGFSNAIVRTEPMGLNISGLFIKVGEKGEKAIRRLIDLCARIVYILSLGRIVASPSIFVIARKG